MANEIQQSVSDKQRSLSNRQERLIVKKVKETVVFDAVNVRATGNVYSADIDISGSEKRSLAVVSTLDQQPTIGLQLKINGTWTTAGHTAQSITGNTLLNASNFKVLGEPYTMIRFYYNCSVAPTTGYLSAVLSEI